MADDMTGKLNTADTLTHFDENGRAIMVDVTGKVPTDRTAVARGCIRVSREVMRAIREGSAAKGDVLGTARIAGIMAVKRTSELIPLCHPLPIGRCHIEFCLSDDPGNDKPASEASCGDNLRSDKAASDDHVRDGSIDSALYGDSVCEVEAVCTVSMHGQTGVEMEALTGVSVALLTVYDMCKAIDKRMEITGIHLVKKTGGKSGDFYFLS